MGRRRPGPSLAEVVARAGRAGGSPDLTLLGLGGGLGSGGGAGGLGLGTGAAVLALEAHALFRLKRDRRYEARGHRGRPVGSELLPAEPLLRERLTAAPRSR